MGERFGLSWKWDAEDARMLLSGEITEESDFEALTSRLPESVLLDLSGVSRINSCGVREWLRFMESLRSAQKQVTLERCSVPIVAQLNSITNFQGGAQVVSFFAPYRCMSCELDDQKLVQVDDQQKTSLPEPPPCPGCAQPMEFDDFEETYLEFTAH